MQWSSLDRVRAQLRTCWAYCGMLTGGSCQCQAVQVSEYPVEPATAAMGPGSSEYNGQEILR